MDGFVTKDAIRRLDIRVAEPWHGLPRVGRLAWSRVDHGNTVEPAGWLDPVAAVIATLSGSGWAEYDGVSHALVPGTAFCFNARADPVRFGYQPDSGHPWTYCWADLEGPASRDAIHELVRRRRHIVPATPMLAAAIMRHLPEQGAIQAAWSGARATAVAWEVLSTLYAAEPAADGSSLVERAIAWMDAHLALPSGVAAAAAAVGVSREHLSRRFRRDLGISAAGWLHHRRIERAETLLAAGIGVIEVSQRVGFASRSHFAAAFRRMRGHAPSAGPTGA